MIMINDSYYTQTINEKIDDMKEVNIATEKW